LNSLRDSPGFFIALMALGFFVGTAGHVYKSQFTVGLGIFMVFSATVLIPGYVYFSD
jgi:hypothetical protein